MLEEEFGELYVRGPWLQFQSADAESPRFCQPDHLVFDPVDRAIYIIESKLKHTPEAWWQLRHLYTPVLAGLFPPQLWKFRVVEIVRWYDPAITFPERVTLIPHVLAVGAGEFGVHIWKP